MRRTIVPLLVASAVLLAASALPGADANHNALAQTTQPRTVLFEFFARST